MNGCVSDWYNNNHYHGNSANTVSTVWQLSEFSSAFTHPIPTAVPHGGIVTVHGFSICGILRLSNLLLQHPAGGSVGSQTEDSGATGYVYFVLSLWFVRHPERHSPRAVFRQEPQFPPGWEALFPVLQPLAEWANDCCCYWTSTKTMFPSLKHSWYEILFKYGSFLQAPYYYTSED